MDRFRASVEAIRRGEEPPEDGYRGEYVRELAALAGDPVPAMLERIEASLERFRIHFDSWALQSRLEERLPELLPRLDTYERDGALWARSSEYGDEQDRVLLRSETPRTDVSGGRRRVPRRQARARFRPRGLRARRRPPRHSQLVRGRRPHARLRPRPRRGAALPARPPDQGRRADEDVEAARRRRLARRLHRRDRDRRRALVPGQSQPRPGDRDRRRPRRRALREEPGLLRPVRPRADRRNRPQRRRRPRVGRADRTARGTRSASWSSGWRSSRRWSPRRSSGVARTA